MNEPSVSTLSVEGDQIEFAPEYQGVTLWLGDGVPVHISDDTAPIDICDLVNAPGQRAVVVARLRHIIESLEMSEVHDFTRMTNLPA